MHAYELSDASFIGMLACLYDYVMNVCVCERERERERELCVCVCVCVCVCDLPDASFIGSASWAMKKNRKLAHSSLISGLELVKISRNTQVHQDFCFFLPALCSCSALISWRPEPCASGSLLGLVLIVAGSDFRHGGQEYTENTCPN